MPDQPGRAIAIAELIRIHGPRRAAEIVREADEAHARLMRVQSATASHPVSDQEANHG